MRSGDGDRSFLLTICTVTLTLFLYPSALFADEYLISYRYIVKDAVLYNEKLLISPAMQKCEGETHDPLILDNPYDDTLETIIDKNNETFIEYLHRLGLQVRHTEQTTNMQNSFTTIMTLPTTCFKVDFNDNSVKIEPLK